MRLASVIVAMSVLFVPVEAQVKVNSTESPPTPSSMTPVHVTKHDVKNLVLDLLDEDITLAWDGTETVWRSEWFDTGPFTHWVLRRITPATGSAIKCNMEWSFSEDDDDDSFTSSEYPQKISLNTFTISGQVIGIRGHVKCRAVTPSEFVLSDVKVLLRRQ